MVDKALYIGMNGANVAMKKLAILTNNLANLSTTGFKGDFSVVQPYQVENTPSRTYSTMQETYSDFKPGLMINTGRDLDVALAGKGFIAVQNKDGVEGYTRAGSLKLTPDGILTTEKGEMVLGEDGLINVPPADRINISKTGMISVHPLGTNGTNLVPVGRIKLVNPAVDNLEKGEDGLFYAQNGQAAALDENVSLVPGALEGSNVSPMVALTDMIELSRDYERQMKLLGTVSEDASTANRLLQMS